MTSSAQPLSQESTGAHPQSVRLKARRIYVAPTRHGVIFALTLLIMLIGSINYNSSLGHGVTFLLVGVALSSMLQTHRNLAGLRWRGGRPNAVFAGDLARFPLHLQADGPDRTAIALRSPDGPPSIVDVAAGDGRGAWVQVRRPAGQRGRLSAGRVRIYTEYPLGLFRAWSWIEPGTECLVYPRAETGAVPAPQPYPHESGSRSGAAAGVDDFRGLRGYRPGDSPRHIAWKRVPFDQDPHTKQFEGSGSTETWLDWDGLPGLEAERRLSRLCRWVLDSDAGGMRYGLRLPGSLISPDSGALHRRRCLEALALLQLPRRRERQR